MPYNVDPGQQEIRDWARKFCEKEIVPLSVELDRRPEPQKFPYDLYKKLSDYGIVGFSMPKEYGGTGSSKLLEATLLEELAYFDAAVCLLAAVSSLACYPIEVFGNQEQKKKYIPNIASGEYLAAYDLTEPSAGSDAGNQQSNARIEDDHFVINGEKIFIMHGDVAHVHVVFCKIIEDAHKSDKSTISAIIVEKGTPGLRAKTLEYKMGMKCATTARVWFEDVRVPVSNLLGEKGKGFRIALQTLDGARIGIAAQAVGIAQRAFDEAVKYARTRVTFGQPIAKYQAIQWMVADMSLRLEAARCLTYKAAQLYDQGEKVTLEASQAKVYATEAAKFCVDRCMQIHGGYGYIGEFSIIEKLYRDQRLTEIYEGTSEIQRLIISGNYLRG
jgi:butyryl-CoA dehydrogenase